MSNDNPINKFAVPLTPYAPGGDLGVGMTDPRIREARRLMKEYDTEMFNKKKAETDNLLCNCGHTHKEHGTSYSINYSAGFCHAEGCECRNFLMKR